MRIEEYYDRMILTLREKYCQEQEERTEGDATESGTKTFWGDAFSMMFPKDWTDMSALEISAGYRIYSGARTILKAPDAEAVLVLSRLPGNEEEADADREPPAELPALWEMIRENMKKLYRQNVFYDNGTVSAGERPVFWQDMKAFCLSGSIYCLIFLFETGNERISGNFHCDFNKYVKWRPTILKMLSTIQVQDGRQKAE